MFVLLHWKITRIILVWYETFRDIIFTTISLYTSLFNTPTLFFNFNQKCSVCWDLLYLVKRKNYSISSRSKFYASLWALVRFESKTELFTSISFDQWVHKHIQVSSYVEDNCLLHKDPILVSFTLRCRKLFYLKKTRRAIAPLKIPKLFL